MNGRRGYKQKKRTAPVIGKVVEADLRAIRDGNAAHRPEGGIAELGLHNIVASARLLGQQGYGMEDIAAMFGVSRSRLDQLVRKAGAVSAKPGRRGRILGIPKYTRRRLFDVALGRFVPMPQIAEYKQTLDTHRRQTMREHRQAVLVTGLRALADRLGRTPTTSEVTEAFGCAWQKNAKAFMPKGYTLLDCTESVGLHDWFAHSGLQVRDTGGRGHVA